jgi:hypothetical protein
VPLFILGEQTHDGSLAIVVLAESVHALVVLHDASGSTGGVGGRIGSGVSGGLRRGVSGGIGCWVSRGVSRRVGGGVGSGVLGWEGGGERSGVRSGIVGRDRRGVRGRVRSGIVCGCSCGVWSRVRSGIVCGLGGGVRGGIGSGVGRGDGSGVGGRCGGLLAVVLVANGAVPVRDVAPQGSVAGRALARVLVAATVLDARGRGTSAGGEFHVSVVEVVSVRRKNRQCERRSGCSCQSSRSGRHGR